MLPGILLASAGGLVALGLGLTFLLGEVKGDEWEAMVFAVCVLGLLPLSLGLGCFGLGVRALNRSSHHEWSRRLALGRQSA